MQLISLHKYGTCLNCMAKNSLAIVTEKGQEILLTEAETIINYCLCNYIVCKSCKAEFNIDWSKDDRLPRPIYDNIDLDTFLGEVNYHAKEIARKNKL